jgi:hypothetical protein
MEMGPLQDLFHAQLEAEFEKRHREWQSQGVRRRQSRDYACGSG